MDMGEKIDDLRDRMARTETATDRMVFLEGKLDKLTDLLNKVITKQAVLAVKVALISSIVATVATLIVSKLF